MTEIVSAIIAAIIEAVVTILTSSSFLKVILASITYVFLFAVIPMLIQFLVPSSVMNAADTYAQMLAGGPSSLTCSGSQPLLISGPGNAPATISCSFSVTMTQIGQGLAYVLSFFQFSALMEVILPVLAVRFLFKRI